ncbi:MAG TPA: DUF4386 domain-containing protein [Candidatus Acidoferrales bacterium]|nr:DUF4386 domain-containing protein [Candidatus Acidoferrales bacterium]
MTLSPRATARVAGVFEVLEAWFSLAGQQLLTGAVVNIHDATATANNILGNETLYRAAVAAGLLAVVWHLVWGYLLYDLFKVIDRTVARFSLLLLVISSTLQAVTGILLFGPLVILRSDALASFTQEQREALSLVFLRLNTISMDIFIAFFGCWLIAIGYLVYRSGFMPRFIGAALAIEGLGWMTYLSPPVGTALFPVIAFFGIFGELFFAGWLLIKGVDNEKWRAAALRDVRVGDSG